MWSVLTKIFTKNSNNDGGGDLTVADGGTGHPQDMDDTKQAKQRASVKWLLSKAFNNKVPENLREPFYKDHENQEHLKPQIVRALANAEIYCMALGNIYSDPNYHNLNHWSILQTLARKGVYVSEPSDAQLTETTLIQTNPLRMSAHMAVIESIMVLYAREVVSSDRVLAAVQRFHHGKQPAPPLPENHEQGLFLWMSHAGEALRKRIEQEDSGVSNGEGSGDRLKPPDLGPINELKDLVDGVALAALISYYCPDELPWTDLKISYVPNVQDSLHNLTLVQDFCNRCLPVSIFHIQPEDVTYMRDSMKQNLVVFLADLFNVIEIHPAKCVRYPGMDKFNEGFPPRNEHGVAHKRNLLQTVMTPIPDLRSGLDDPAASAAFQVTRSTPTHVPLRKTNSLQQSMSEMSEDSLRRGSEDSFVVHRGKNIPTLRSVVHDEPLIPGRLKVNKEKQNNDSKADERGEIAAGRPSNWEENRKSTFAGRRSRRNSTSDDSQLTIENFGGSQDNLNFIGRNPDKEMGVHVGRKISAPSFPTENPAVRSSIQDARGSIQLGYDNGCEKNDDETEKFKLKRQLSSDDISLRNILSNKENIMKDVVDAELSNRMSFAELNKKAGDHRAIQLVYMQHEKEEYKKPPSTNGNPEKKTSFAALPNTTTWQQQSSNVQQVGETNGGPETGSGTAVNAAQLNDVRLKLEEKRRLIESEKRRMELAMSKQRQKVGKAAFLQAVARGRGNLLKTPTDAESNSNSATGSESQSPSSETAPTKPQRPFTLQEINDDTSAVERKWLDESQPFIETRRTPDLDNMDLEQYQQSIAQMNSSLSDIQTDIQRLASQQNQMQAVQQQSIIAQQQKQIQQLQQQQHQYQSMQQQQQQQHYVQQQPIYSPQIYQQQPQPSLQTSASAPHIPQSLYQQSRVLEQPQFFLHDQNPPMTPPVVTQRRTWAQQPPPSVGQDVYQPELRTWNKMGGSGGGFVLHDTPAERYDPKYQQPEYRFVDNSKYQNGGDEHNLHHSSSFTLSQQHHQHQPQVYGTSHSTPSASPQHRNIHRQISQLMDESKRTPVSLQQMDRESPLRKTSSVTHAPIPAPSADDMEPQNISFIGNAEDQQLSEGLSSFFLSCCRLNITSGSRTYRIPSPTRPLITRNSFQPSPPPEKEAPIAEISSLDNDPTNQKGFYIQFDDDQPKRPKPPLRTKRGSPKKERSYVETTEDHEQEMRAEKKKLLERELEDERVKKEDEDKRRQMLVEQEREKLRAKREASQESQKVASASALIIDNESGNPDPDAAERMKKRILLASLQRKQEQEEAKARKEQEAQARREREKAKEEEKIRKKEEQAARRVAILEQYKLKKAMEEAEREGKVFDKSEMMGTLKPTPKMRPKAASRPRPKTIHIDSGSVEMAEGMMQPSRGKKGSTSNLTANSTMKRDYYRGSQDSLADRSMSSGMLYRDSPDDSRGVSPCHNANQTLGRRSSYKTSRDPSPAQVRGRPKYSNYQNFKGRKSSSLMNLYGSSTDQDSLAYRYGDTDSGLGRATPPRRAPSPGMGSMRHLTSPSGPGSLPGLMTKGRRIFDDGSSDISSTPSSMMDYTGPRLYKQPATKSNRGIMLNAVEYCVFPGVVNREAKKRVLEEINRSESKHFLILFRDAGCQFRALYSYCPDREDVTKLYGTGPKQVNDRMFDKFFKYNSGGKCFSQVHTKHLTVTIDAFTIHNSLWQGKKVNLPNKKDMPLVI
ncbi:patronin isoform X4 [Zophobas morio]|uniref:patronin isoform X4 n=1 Tax=Zophobas morio TaxID=2755281 RepID=UPI00308338BB